MEVPLEEDVSIGEGLRKVNITSAHVFYDVGW